MLALPIIVSATVNVTVWTDQSSYTLGDTVKTDATWTVSPTGQWDYCNVSFGYRLRDSSTWFQYLGYYSNLNNTGWGNVTITSCGSASGAAWQWWDSSVAQTGTWYVEVSVLLTEVGVGTDGGMGWSSDFELT
jgi:hypothetical protein